VAAVPGFVEMVYVERAEIEEPGDRREGRRRAV
jgi:hypothetical protein